MNTTARTAAPKRVRKPKAGNLGPKAQAVADTAPNDEAVRSVIATLAASYDTDLAQAVADERARWVRSVSPDDLRAKLSDLTGIRQRAASEIERLASEHAAMTRNLLAIDGAIQAVSELVEAAEGKGAADA